MNQRNKPNDVKKPIKFIRYSKFTMWIFKHFNKAKYEQIMNQNKQILESITRIAEKIKEYRSEQKEQVNEFEQKINEMLKQYYR